MVELRPLTLSDADVFAFWALDPVFCAHAGWRKSAAADETVAWWRNLILSPDRALLRLAAIRGPEIVGFVDLHGDVQGKRELGFVIGPSDRWGLGLGKRVARAGLNYGFSELGLSSIWAEAVEANIGSVRILQHLGMTYTGQGSQDMFLGAPSTYLQFNLARSDWLRQSAKLT